MAGQHFQVTQQPVPRISDLYQMVSCPKLHLRLHYAPSNEHASYASLCGFAMAMCGKCAMNSIELDSLVS